VRFSLDVPVERRAIKEKSAIQFSLGFPALSGEALADWQARSLHMIQSLKPGRLPGPVKLSLTYEERPGRRDLDHLIGPVVDLLVRHALIDSDHRSILREIRAQWGEARGVRIAIEALASRSGAQP
jgi:Holliday junction resolvase RusA-like endonuclease